MDTTENEAKETPLCLKCLQPVDPLMHYCPNCGEAVGQLTPYIPFVNIRFNYSIFSTMWKKIWEGKDTGVFAKIFYLFLIVLCAPIMLIGLPFVLFKKEKPNPDENQKPLPTNQQPSE